MKPMLPPLQLVVVLPDSLETEFNEANSTTSTVSYGAALFS